MSLVKRPLFNPDGDIDIRQRRMIGGNTTNLNDFNNMKYQWGGEARGCLLTAPSERSEV